MLFVWTPPQTMTQTGFDVFWASYPRHVGKKDALKAWNQLRPSEALVQEMLAALAWQTQQPQWTKDDGAFIPYPASWLRGERWTDEPPRTARVVTWTRDEATCPNCGHPGGQCRDVKVCNAHWLESQKARAGRRWRRTHY